MFARGHRIVRRVVGAVGGAGRGGIAGVAGGVLAGLVLAGAAASIAEGAPRGKVVRVERAKVAPPPRLCELPARGQPVCYGSPREGDRVAVIVADQQVVGSFVIEEVGRSTELYERGLCSGAGVHAVKGRGMRGTADPYTDLVGLRGVTLGERARVLAGWSPPSGRADELVLVAVDTDGDSDVDVAVTRYRCDATGAVDPDADFFCYDTFARERGRLRRTSQDVLRACS